MPTFATEPPAAFVFDAYGTLFDVHSVAALADTLAPGRGAELSRLWRTKQLEYTWLTSLMASTRRPRKDFDKVTERALEFAVAALGLSLRRDARRKLCAAYLSLAPFPDARAALAGLVPIQLQGPVGTVPAQIASDPSACALAITCSATLAPSALPAS